MGPVWFFWEAHGYEGSPFLPQGDFKHKQSSNIAQASYAALFSAPQLFLGISFPQEAK